MSDEACEKHLPVETHTVDYITASNTVRDDRSRTVTKQVGLLRRIIDKVKRRRPSWPAEW